MPTERFAIAPSRIGLGTGYFIVGGLLLVVGTFAAIGGAAAVSGLCLGIGGGSVALGFWIRLAGQLEQRLIDIEAALLNPGDRAIVPASAPTAPGRPHR